MYQSTSQSILGFVSLKIHRYGKPGLSRSRRCVNSPATALKGKYRHKNAKEKEEGKQHGALNLYRS